MAKGEILGGNRHLFAIRHVLQKCVGVFLIRNGFVEVLHDTEAESLISFPASIFHGEEPILLELAFVVMTLCSLSDTMVMSLFLDLDERKLIG